MEKKTTTRQPPALFTTTHGSIHLSEGFTSVFPKSRALFLQTRVLKKTLGTNGKAPKVITRLNSIMCYNTWRYRS